MNKVFYHSTNSEIVVFRIIYSFLGLLFLYGLYKNGISLYIEGYTSFYGSLGPILVMGLCFILPFIFRLIDKTYFRYRLLFNVLIGLCSPMNVIHPIGLNTVIFIVLLVLCNFIFKYFRTNITALFMSILGIIYYFLDCLTFSNIKEVTFTNNYGFFEYLFGKGVGGIGNTFILLSIIGFIFLLNNINYKKIIPIVGFITYYVLLIFSSFILQNASYDLFLNSNIIFAFIFTSTIPICTPYSRGGTIIYGFLMGVITFITTFIDPSFGVYLAIFLLSIFHKFMDKIIVNH